MISRPVWSPDGHLIYYESTRDNHICLWAQRIGAAGQPTGAPISAAHFHHSVESLLGAGVPFGITRDTLYVLLAEVKGNVWMVKVGRP